MQIDPIESSNLKAVGYDPATRIMRVVFRSGKTYDYGDVTPEDHELFINSKSKGAHFSKHIRNCHECTQHSESD
jgi:hypothetical protein